MNWQYKPSPIHLLYALSMLVIAVLWGTLAYYLSVSYDSAIKDAQQRTRNIAQVLKEHTASSIKAIDVVLNSIASLTTDHRIHTLHTPDAQAFLQNFLTYHSEVRDIVILDQDGNMTHSVIYRSYSKSYNFADRSYFRVHRNPRYKGLYIEPPMIAQVDDQWFMAMSLRLNWPGNGFAGVAFAVVDPEYFRQLYDSIELGPNTLVALYRDDGRLMISQSYPPPDQRVESDTIRVKLPEGLSGTFETEGADGIMRILSYLPIENTHLVIGVGIAEDHALAKWWSQTRQDVLAAGLATFAILSLCFLLSRQIERQETTNRRLLESERRLERAQEGLTEAQRIAHLGNWEWDIPAKKVFWSEQMYSLFGCTPEDFDGNCEAFLDFVHPDDQPAVSEAIGRALEQRNPFAIEHRIIRFDGAERWIQGRGKITIFDEAGAPSYMIGTVLDITERKQAELESQRKAQQLAKMDRQKNQFLAMFGHELRNPLTAIRNIVDLINSQPEAATPKLRKALETIDHQVALLTRIVDDLLDISRISHGKIKLHKRPVELSAICSQAVEASRSLIDARSHILTVSLPQKPVWLEADPIRLIQALSNLLNNAANYTPTGGRIQLKAQRKNSKVTIKVQDNGAGIPPDKLPHIFDLFFQGEQSLDRPNGGLGIGLTLVRQIAEMHDGSVQAHSEGQNQGSEFELRLSVLPEAPLPETSIPKPASVSAARSVLIVDDDVVVANSLALLLESMNHKVRTVHDGEAALAAVSDFQPDLVFIDIGLPGMNGYEVARRLRKKNLRKPMMLVALSGYGQEEIIDEARTADFDRHLLKPLNRGELEAVLASAK